MKTSRPGDYEVRRLASIEEFVETTLHWLKSDEEKNNSLIAVAQAIERGKPAYDGPKWFGCVERQSTIEGCLINTSLDGLLTSDLPAGATSAVCDSLEEAKVEVRKINGPSETIAKLADELCARSSCLSWRVSHEWQCYMLQRLIWPKWTAPGQLRHCTDDEREKISHWGELYGEEKPAPIPVPDFLLRKVDDQDLYVWDDDGAKMLLTISGRTKKSALISAVYTPKEYRRRGYASMAVAEITKRLLGEGCSYVTLLVDDDDEPVKQIYKRLGYEETSKKANIVIEESKDSEKNQG